MTDPRDPFEAELSALRPLDVSPELRGRIASELAVPPSRRVLPGRWLAAVGGMAACLGAWLLVRGWGEVGPGPTSIPPGPAPIVNLEDAPPTLLAYQRALARSPEDLGALIDRQALAAPDFRPGPSSILETRHFYALRTNLMGDD